MKRIKRFFSSVSLTLDDGEEDDNDEEEERDVENHALHLELVPGGVFDLVANASPCSHTHIHVEYVALKENKGNDMLFFCVCIAYNILLVLFSGKIQHSKEICFLSRTGN